MHSVTPARKTAGQSKMKKSHPWGAIFGLQATLLLSALDQTIVSTAMPRIIADLSGFDRYAWVTTAYLVTSTASLPVFGKLSDMFGRKVFLLSGALLFVLASVLCGFAGLLPAWLGDGMTQLIAFRALQGIAGGLIMALTFASIADLFPPAERGKYQGLFSAVFGLASVLGPIIGGWLTDTLTWRWIFFVNVPVGALALTALYFGYPAHVRQKASEASIDVGGVLTLVSWVVPLLLALTWVPISGLTSPPVLIAAAIAAIAFAAFIAVEAGAREPIIPLTLFQNKIIAVSCITLFIVGVAMFGSILFLPLLLQGALSMSASKAGSLMTPMMLAMTAFSVVSGQVISRVGKYKAVAFAGLMLLAVGLYLLTTVSGDSELLVIGKLLIVGGGLGLLMPVYTLAVQNAVPHAMVGVATSTTQFFRSIGGTLGAALFGSIMLDRYHDLFIARLPSHIPAQVVQAFMNPLRLTETGEAARALTGISDSMKSALFANMQSALVQSIDTIFFVGMALVLSAVVVNIFLQEIPLRKHFDHPPPAPAEVEVI